MGTVHPDHPGLYYAKDLRQGWRLLYYQYDQPISHVEITGDRVRVTFEGDMTDAWHPDDQVHAQPGA